MSDFIKHILWNIFEIKKSLENLKKKKSALNATVWPFTPPLSSTFETKNGKMSVHIYSTCIIHQLPPYAATNWSLVCDVRVCSNSSNTFSCLHRDHPSHCVWFESLPMWNPLEYASNDTDVVCTHSHSVATIYYCK